MKLIRITETPNGDGMFTRTLTFEKPAERISDSVSTAPTIKTYEFPPDRMSIIVGGKLYDWYGREVEIDGRIGCVIRPFGAFSNGDSADEAHEVFIVRLKNRRFSIATLERKDEKIAEIPHFKGALTGDLLDHESRLVPGRHSYIREDTKIVKTPVFQTYLRNSKGYQKNEDVHAFYGVRDDGDALGSRELVTVFYGNACEDIGNTWRWFHVAESREKIMASEKVKSVSCIQLNHLVDKITVSEDGCKMSARIPWHTPEKKNGRRSRRVSTDVEVIEHVGESYELYWYFDD